MYVIVTFTILAVCMTAKADGYERMGCLVNWTPGAIVQVAQTRSGTTDIAYSRWWHCLHDTAERRGVLPAGEPLEERVGLRAAGEWTGGVPRPL